MLNVGLTGGIGCGKSTVAKILQEKGAHVIDFDSLAHYVEEPGRPVWKAIVERFGPEILNDDGTISRVKLGAIVFKDRNKLSLLNTIVHPAVFHEWQRRLQDIQDRDPEAIVISDIPLLFEAGIQALVDMVLLVYSTPEDQLQRIVERNGYSRQEALRRLSSQMPIEEKVKHADMVIDNQGAIEKTREAVDRIWPDLLAREHKKHKHK